MIYERDLDESIARYQGEPNPSISTCIKLAACMTLKREMFGGNVEGPGPAYSFSALAPTGERGETVIEYEGRTDFAREIRGRRAADIWPKVEELVSALEAFYPKLYAGFMGEIRR